MGAIQNHYQIESEKEKPNTLLLSILSKILERKSLTLNEWRLTGKFIPKAEYIKDNPTADLLSTCKEVIEYVGKYRIEVLGSGTFRYTSTIKSKVLDEVEDKIWNEIAEKLFCDEC